MLSCSQLGPFSPKPKSCCLCAKWETKDPELCKGLRVPAPKCLTCISLIQSCLNTFIEHLIFVI